MIIPQGSSFSIRLRSIFSLLSCAPADESRMASSKNEPAIENIHFIVDFPFYCFPNVKKWSLWPVVFEQTQQVDKSIRRNSNGLTLRILK